MEQATRAPLHATCYQSELGSSLRAAFLNKFGSKQRFREAEYQGYDYHQRVQGKWRQTREWYGQSADAPSPELSNHFLHFDYADATSWEWICWQEKSVAQVWHTKQGVYRRRVRADVRDEPMQVQQCGISSMAAGYTCSCQELFKDIFLLDWCRSKVQQVDGLHLFV